VSKAAHVWPHPPTVAGDLQEISADVEWPKRFSHRWRKDQRQRVWIRVPVDVPIPEAAVGDAFLLGTFFGGMHLARELHVHAKVSDGLVERVTKLGPIWQDRRKDRYRAIEVKVDSTAPPVAPREGPSLLCFSGGLDSAYSVRKHTDSARPAHLPRLYATLMVHGADIPVTEAAAFGVASARTERMATDRGVPLLRAATNLRVVRQNWSHSSNATLAGIMGLFRTRCARGLLAVGFTTEEGMRWWPQDVVDPPLLSSDAFPVAGDGYEADRFQKLVAIADWPQAMQDLRVCYRPGSWTTNCGECLKCWTLGFFAEIVLGKGIPCLPRRMTLADAQQMTRADDENLVLRIQQIVRHARARGFHSNWLSHFERELA
jgi:hypothetical protein